MENAIPAVKDVEIAAQERLSEVKGIILKFTPDFSVSTGAEAEIVANDLKIISTMLKKVDEQRKAFTKPLDGLKKFFMEAFRPAETELKNADAIARGALLSYQQQERRKAEEAARKERERQEALMRAEVERLKKLQEEAELVDDQEAVEQIAEEKQAVETQPIPVAPVETPKFEGIGTQKVWKGEVVDLTELLKFIVETGEHINLITPNTKDIGTLAKATKGTLKIPGIRFYSEEGVRVRA
ncbi:MAG: hypothetical protein LBQ37_02625 [Elusimicrobiota bacterium]|jgi:ATPase subunit of ABC transporter with duplicated ATPase domains|nr:hypothetical protein [Elusimicrobiota bacterium]